MTDITELAQSLKAAAEEATPGGWCIDDYHGVIADAGLNGNYYIASCSGPDHRSNKRFIALSNPANVLALVETLEKAQKSNEFLKGQLSELANFNPDWDKLEASYESWREIAAELLVAKDRIAELESRTVTVSKSDIFNVPEGKNYVGGEMIYVDTLRDYLADLGIKVEAE